MILQRRPDSTLGPGGLCPCPRAGQHNLQDTPVNPSKEHPGLISFTMDWLDLLAVQGTLKSLLQHHSSKASILRRSAFFIVQPSHPYMTTGKTIALTRCTFVGKVPPPFPYLYLSHTLTSHDPQLTAVPSFIMRREKAWGSWRQRQKPPGDTCPLGSCLTAPPWSREKPSFFPLESSVCPPRKYHLPWLSILLCQEVLLPV